MYRLAVLILVGAAGAALLGRNWRNAEDWGVGPGIVALLAAGLVFTLLPGHVAQMSDGLHALPFVRPPRLGELARDKLARRCCVDMAATQHQELQRQVDERRPRRVAHAVRRASRSRAARALRRRSPRTTRARSARRSPTSIDERLRLRRSSALRQRGIRAHAARLAHVLSGYDTSLQGELLVSTFTAGMHPDEPITGHILPVIIELASRHRARQVRRAPPRAASTRRSSSSHGSAATRPPATRSRRAGTSGRTSTSRSPTCGTRCGCRRSILPTPPTVGTPIGTQPTA